MGEGLIKVGDECKVKRFVVFFQAEDGIRDHCVTGVQTCALPSLTSHTQPEQPSSQSQSLSRSYGSILPTSLTYVILSARGFSPWRPAADMGTTLHEIYTPLYQIFKGRHKRAGCHKTCDTLRDRYPYLRANRFQGSLERSLNKKR